MEELIQKLAGAVLSEAGFLGLLCLILLGVIIAMGRWGARYLMTDVAQRARNTTALKSLKKAIEHLK